MKAFITKYYLIISILAGSVAAEAQVVQYVKKDSSVTYTVQNLNNVPANFTWSVVPSLTSFSASSDSIQFVAWTGDTGLYTLTVVPKSVVGGCIGDSKSLLVHVYSSQLELPIQISWVAQPDSFCPDPNGGGNTVAAELNVTDKLQDSINFKLYYQIDNDTVSVYNNDSWVGLNTKKSPITLQFSSLDFAGKNVSTSHVIKIVKIITQDGIVQPYKDADAPKITVIIKAIPVLNNEIEF